MARRVHLNTTTGIGRPNKQKGEFDMLYYALVFFVIALIAAVFGFGGIAVAAAGIAKILFFLFLVVFLVTLVMGMARRA
jgi:uncharacterized membrane protein YtjA (UPF0391 family)